MIELTIKIIRNIEQLQAQLSWNVHIWNSLAVLVDLAVVEVVDDLLEKHSTATAISFCSLNVAP